METASRSAGGADPCVPHAAPSGPTTLERGSPPIRHVPIWCALNVNCRYLGSIPLACVCATVASTARARAGTVRCVGGRQYVLLGAADLIQHPAEAMIRQHISIPLRSEARSCEANGYLQRELSKRTRMRHVRVAGWITVPPCHHHTATVPPPCHHRATAVCRAPQQPVLPVHRSTPPL